MFCYRSKKNCKNIYTEFLRVAKVGEQLIYVFIDVLAEAASDSSQTEKQTEDQIIDKNDFKIMKVRTLKGLIMLYRRTQKTCYRQKKCPELFLTSFQTEF